MTHRANATEPGPQTQTLIWVFSNVASLEARGKTGVLLLAGVWNRLVGLKRSSISCCESDPLGGGTGCSGLPSVPSQLEFWVWFDQTKILNKWRIWWCDEKRLMIVMKEATYEICQNQLESAVYWSLESFWMFIYQQINSETIHLFIHWDLLSNIVLYSLTR